MKKTFYLALIIMSLLLFTSCTTKNNIIDNPANDVIEISAENPNGENGSDNSNTETFSVTVNINPKSSDKWQGNTDKANVYIQDVNTNAGNHITLNFQVYTADGIEIYFRNGTAIKTHDTVKIENEKIIIAGDTFIDANGNIVENGKGKFTIVNKDGVKTEINGGNQSTYIGTNPDGDALESYNKSGIKGIIDFLPYMSKNAIDEIAKAEYEKVGSFEKLDEIILVYMSNSLSTDLALKEYEKNGFKSIPNFTLMYMSTEVLDELVQKEAEKNGFKNFDFTIYPYISENTIDELVKREFEKSGFENFDFMLCPYISEHTIDELVVMEYEKNGFRNFYFMIYPYISENIMNELAKKEYEKRGFRDFDFMMYSYINENTIDELVKAEYEKNGLESLENVAQHMSESCMEEIKQKEYEKTGVYPIINDNIGRHFTRTDSGLEIVETPFMGEVRYVTVEENESTKEEITKVGKDGEYAEIYTKNNRESKGTAKVTIKDGDKTVVVTRDADGVISVTVEQNGNSETTEINPEVNPVITIVLNGKTVEVSQTSKSGTAYVRVTRGDVTARIKIAKKAEINVLDYLLTTPLYGT